MKCRKPDLRIGATDRVCFYFQCDLEHCAFFDCAGTLDDDECDGCARCTICQHYRKRNKQKVCVKVITEEDFLKGDDFLVIV